MSPALRRLAAAAGIGFVVLAGIESLDILGAPGPDGPASEVVAFYSGNHTQLWVTTVCGALSLVCYIVFAVCMQAGLRARGARGAWPALALVAGVGGPVLGGIGQVAQFVLVDRGAAGAAEDPDHTLALYAFDLHVQAAGAALIGLFLLACGVAGRRTGLLPAWASGAALALSPVLVAAALIGLASDAAARGALVPALALHTLWVLAIGVWLLLSAWEPARGERPSMTLARIMFGAVGVAAGLSGIALLAAPSATADYFAWGLAPAPLASLIGGFYLASSVVYLLGARAGWGVGRVLTIGILALSLPIFVATLVDLDLFDFGRLPAWTWVLLFGVFGPAALAVLAGQRDEPSGEAGGRRLGTAVRVGLLMMAVPLLALAIALWSDPVGGESYLPFEPPTLSGRVLGTWAFLLAAVAAWSALRDRVGEAWPALLALALFPVGALIAAARSFPDLEPDGRWAYVAVLAAWLAAALALAWAARPPAGLTSAPARAPRSPS